MREIKFRSAHYTYDDKFSHFSYWGLLNHLGEFDENCFCSPSQTGRTTRKVEEQFTGLYDKKRTEEFPNGQPIYEGDILKIHFGHKTQKELTFTCTFEHGAFGIRQNYELSQFVAFRTAYDQCILNGVEEKYEVIGNVHENKELL